MRLSLRMGERLYINGAVLRADRKVTLELMNDAAFLLEAHVLQPGDTTTPLRQLYFIIQTLLMEGGESAQALQLYRRFMSDLCSTIVNPEIREGLRQVELLMSRRRHFEALKTLRGLFAREGFILNAGAELAATQRGQASCR